MMRSLYSGVSGLTTHQTRMDVIGNNIANVNTNGFKASKVTFRDIYYQTAISASAGRTTYAGNNSAQVGYGVRLGSIDKDMSLSNFQPSNRVWDMAISGDGFFMTTTFDNQNINSNKTASTVKYTRMGSFTVDSLGNLVTSVNTFVVGSRNTLKGLRAIGSDSLHEMGNVEVVDRNGDGNVNASDITFRNTINLTELMQEAYNVYTDDYGFMYRYDWPKLIYGTENTYDDDGNITGSTVINSNLPDPSQVSADGLYVTSANGLFVYDLAAFGGTAQQFLDRATKKDADGEPLDPAQYDVDFLMQYLDVQQTTMNFNEAFDPEKGNAADKATVIGYREYVDKTGQPIEMQQQKDADGNPAVDDAGNPVRYTYADLYNAMDGADGDALITAKAEAQNAGAIIGKLTFGDAEAVNVSAEGYITITYNSQMKTVARIELAVFDNPDGLNEDGLTTFTESPASGDAKIKRAGVDPGVTETSIQSNYLEASNVNLAQEFSDMIVTQRGFQANARIITTADSMLEELVNLKR